jgi:hypothetical protein
MLYFCSWDPSGWMLRRRQCSSCPCYRTTGLHNCTVCGVKCQVEALQFWFRFALLSPPPPTYPWWCGGYVAYKGHMWLSPLQFILNLDKEFPKWAKWPSCMTPNSEIVAKIKTAVYYVASQQFSQCPNTPSPSSYGSGFLPIRLHFHVHVLGFCLLFLLYLIYNNQSVTFLP